jgi:hypothetical protein
MYTPKQVYAHADKVNEIIKNIMLTVMIIIILINQ